MAEQKKKKSILLVESEKIVTLDLRAILSTSAYRILGDVSSGKQALAFVLKHKPDVVIIDIDIRGDWDGIETALKIQEVSAMPIIFLTGSSDSQTLDRAKAAHPYGFVLKPFDGRDVRTSVEMALFKHQYEQEVNESRQWLSTTLRSIGDGVIATDKSSKIVFMNAIAEQLCGWKEQEASGKKLSEVFVIFDEQTERRMTPPTAKVFREKKIVELSARTVLLSKEGIKTHIEDSAAPIYNDKNEISGVVLTFRDVTEKRKAQQALADNERRFRTLVERSAEAYAILDSRGKIIFSTHSAVPIHGYQAEELLGKNVLDFIHELDKAKAEAMLQNILSSFGRSATIILRLRHKDNSWRWLEAVGTNVLNDPFINGVVFNFRDVTYRIKAAESLEHTNSRLDLIARVTGEVIGTQAVQRQIRTMSEQVKNAFRVDVVIVRVFEDKKAKLMAVIGMPETDVTFELPAKYGLTNLILTSKHAIAMKNISEAKDIIYPRFPEVDDKTRDKFISCAGSPILIGHVIVGTLAIYTLETPQEFTTTDLDHLQIVANHMAVVIANNKLFKEIKNQNDLLQQEVYVREQAEAHLRDSEERYRTLVELSPLTIAVHLNGVIKFVNAAGLQLIGAHSKDEVLGTNVIEYVHPNYRKIAQGRVENVYEGKAAPSIVQKWLRMDGSIIDVEVSSIPFIFEGQHAAQIIARDISEQKENELQLREAVQFTNEIISNAGEGIIVYDREYRYKLWNNFMERLTGILQESLLGKNAFEIFPHLLEEGVDKLLDRALAGEVVTSEDVNYFVPGTIRSSWMTGTYAPHRSADGKIIGVIVTLRDITDRKISEEALRESELRFRTLFENAKDAVFITDPKTGEIIDANREAEKLLLWSRDEIIGMHQTHLHPSSRMQEAQEIFQDAMLMIDDNPIEFEILRSDNVVVPVEIKASIIRLDEERIVVQSIFRDITERKKAEQELREKEERYRAFVEQSSEGIYRTAFDKPISTTLDIDEQIRLMFEYAYIAECNVVMAKMYGFETVEEAVGVRLRSLLIESDKENIEFMRKFVMKGYQIFDYESHERDKEHEHKYFLNNGIGIIEDGMWLGVWGTQRDVTEKKRLEEQLVQAQKMESIGTLAGGIAHDFNNLLAMILGTAELVKKQTSEEGKIYSYIQKIIEASQRGASISKQLLLFARPEQAELKPMVVDSFLNEICDFLSHFLPKSIVVEQDIPEKNLLIMGDDGQLHQALLNLSINARDAMKNTGTLLLSVRRKTGENVRKYIPQAENIDYVVIGISDTGVGIPDEVRRRMFEPFYSTKERGKGTGLGLSIVHGIMKIHQGYIDTKSQLNVGTTFYLYFPLLQIAHEETVEAVPEYTGTYSESILIVDDEEMIREILKESLSDAGYNIFTAADGYEALKIFQARAEDIQIVISDLDMPIMNGYELFDNLKKINPHVNVIASSGYLDAQTRNKLFDLGIREVITKPYKFEDIFHVIRTILDSNHT